MHNLVVKHITFIIKEISGKARKPGTKVRLCFVDLVMALDRIKKEDVWKRLKNRKIDEKVTANSALLIKSTINKESAPFQAVT